MEKIITYEDIPRSIGQSIYYRMETNPTLYVSLIKHGYRIVNRINEADDETIYVTGQRQVRDCFSAEEYLAKFDKKFLSALGERQIEKPRTKKFTYEDLVNGNYKLPFVFKNNKAHGGCEKFLIATELDYEQLIKACNHMLIIQRERRFVNEILRSCNRSAMPRGYEEFVEGNYSIQEFVETPTKYCTSVRLLTSSSDDLLCGVLKYNLPGEEKGKMSLLGYLLREVYPLGTKSIQSNTLRGGRNIIIDSNDCSREEREILGMHKLTSDQFHNVVEASRQVHSRFKTELGILCGFDYIYDRNKEKWYLLEYHGKPMVGDYAVACGLPYNHKPDIISADGLVRATALSLTLRKQRHTK